MKIISICDDPDICTGLRLVGIEGIMVNSSDTFIRTLEGALRTQNADIIVIPKKYSQFVADTQKDNIMPSIMEI